MFISEAEVSVDSKGRIFMPVKYRNELGMRFYLTRGLDRCITIYPEPVWNAFCEKINSAPESRSKELRRYLFPMTEEVSLDSGGRALINAKLRNHAGIEKEAVLVGVGKKLELWSPEIYRSDVVESFDMNEIMAQLREIEETI